MVRENEVKPADLILPLFVVPDGRPRVEISSMPGVYQDRVPEIVEACVRAWELGIKSVLLFGIPDHKDDIGSVSWDPTGPVQSAIRAISKAVPGMTIIPALAEQSPLLVPEYVTIPAPAAKSIAA